MRYRIVAGNGYDGCIPITVYWVQMSKPTWYGIKWENIKGFDTLSRANYLLKALRGEY